MKPKKADMKRYPKNPLRNIVQKRLREVFGDLPIVDATETLVLFPTLEDFAEATRRDPTNCGFTRCAARCIGSRSALVFANTAYFDHLGKDGVRRIHRYMIGRATKAIIKGFDIGTDINVAKAFVFLAPTKKGRLPMQRAKGRRYRNTPRGAAIIKADMAKSALRRAEADLENMRARLTRLSERRSATQSPQTAEARQQVLRLEMRARILRDDAEKKEAKANELRIRPYRSLRTNGHEHNLDMRNGRGFLTARRHVVASETYPKTQILPLKAPKVEEASAK